MLPQICAILCQPLPIFSSHLGLWIMGRRNYTYFSKVLGFMRRRGHRVAHAAHPQAWNHTVLHKFQG